MKLKRLLSWLTALVMLVSLLPAGALPASANGAGTRTILVGVINYIDQQGDSYLLRYWGGADGAQDAPLNDIGREQSKTLGSDFWNDDPQTFRLYTAEIPADATGFKLHYEYRSEWFGASDGDTALHDRLFAFEYGGEYRALYDEPISNVGTAEDWAALAADLDAGLDYAGRFLTMTDDFSTNVPLGDESHPFRGSFNGDNHTLDIHVEDPGMWGAAPFRAIADGAAIVNLNVTGSVLGSYHSAGLVAIVSGGTEQAPNLVDNCTVYTDVGGDAYNGGVVGHGTSSYLTIRNTVYLGAISDGWNNSGGLQGWGDSNTLTVENCLFAGSYTGTGSFDPIAVGYGDHSFTNAYYVAPPEGWTSEGTPATMDTPTDSLATEAVVRDRSVWVCHETRVEDVDEWYLYTGSPIPLAPTVWFNNNQLTEGTDYTWTIDGQSVTSVTAKGFHELTVTGIGDYNGSVTVPVTVINATLPGSGTQSDPWRIEDAADWVRFCLDIENGSDFDNEYVQLTADIPIRRMAGVVQGNFQDKAFSGDFDGGGYTLTVELNNTWDQGTAPFCCIDGAVIHDLNTTGTVYGGYHAAGLVGFVKGTGNLVERCFVSANVYADDYLGGIVGHGLDSELTLRDCVYSGTLVGGSNAKGALLGWDDSGDKYVDGCFYIASDDQSPMNLSLTSGLGGSVHVTDCYTSSDVCQEGTLIYKFPLPDVLFGYITAPDGAAYVLPCEIRGVAAVYNCADGPVAPAPTVEFAGTLLTEGTDYTLRVTDLDDEELPGPLTELGSYRLVVEGCGSYTGQELFPFEVGQITWALEADGSGQYTILHFSGFGPMEDLEAYPYDGQTARWGIPAADLTDVLLVVIDVGITSIGAYAFDGLSSLEKAIIPAGLTRIGKYAFPTSGSAFTELRLPASLEKVEEYAFCGLDYVTELYCGREQNEWWDFVWSDRVNTDGNSVLTGYNNNWQPVDSYYEVLSSILTGPVAHGSVHFMVDGQDASQASDGQLVYVIPEADDGYELDEVHISFQDHGAPVDLSIQPLWGFTMPCGADVTVTPSFRAIQYHISYQGLQGVQNPPANPTGYTVETPSFTLTNPTKTGYSFLGWRLNGGATLALNATVYQGTTGDLDFAAEWSANPYTIHFDANGGTGTMTDQSFTYDTAQPLSRNAFTRLGYNFLGWNTRADGQGTAYSDEETVQNLTATANDTVTLYAQWAANSYTVVFDPNGGTGTMQNQRFTYDLPQALNANAYTRSCYHFVEWNLAPDGSGAGFQDGDTVSNLTPVNGGTVTLYAVWAPYSYTVQFDANGGSGNMPDQPFTYDAPQPLSPNAFTRPGYTFTGWNTRADGLGAAYADGDTVLNLTTVDNDVVVLYAQWSAHSYTVQFDPNGGVGSMPDQPMTFGTAANLDPNAFTLAGYDFTGWNTQPDGNGTSYADGDSVQDLTTVDNGVVVLYAQWDPWMYTILFLPNNSAATGNMPNQCLVYDAPQPLDPIAYDVTGYHFTHWCTTASGSGGTDYQDGETVNLLLSHNGAVKRLFAQWAPNTYTVHFDPNGGTGGPMPDHGLTYDVADTLTPNVFTRQNYSFNGWNTQPDGLGTPYADGASVMNLTTGQGDVVILYAQWTAATYTVVFDPNGAPNGTMANQAIPYDTAVTLTPNAYSWPGYHFDAWCDVPGGVGGIFLQDQEPVLNLATGPSITLYAQWKPNDYVVIFDPNAPVNSWFGSMQNQSFTYGVTQNLYPISFVRPGYTFLGWDTLPGGGGLFFNDMAPGSNIPVANDAATVTLYAQWQVNSYNVHFDANLGTGTQMPDQSFVYDQWQNLDANTYTRTGYTFVGWCEDIEGSGYLYSDRENVLNLTDQNNVTVTLYAIWEPVSWTVIYHPNGPNAPDQYQVFYYDQPQAIQPNPYFYPNMHFVEWRDDPNGGGTIYNPGQILLNTFAVNGMQIDLYARWVPGSYTVVFNPNAPAGGYSGAMANQTLPCGVNTALTPNAYTRPGFNFDHWEYTDYSTSSSGTVRSYQDCEAVSITNWDGAICELYAQWKGYDYTVVFHPNNANATGAMLNENFVYGQPRALFANAYEVTGYHFQCWTTQPTGGTTYTNQQVVDICPASNNATVHLYAQWKNNTYYVDFDANGGTGSMGSQMFTYGVAGTLNPNVFTRVGYTFIGWNTRADGSGTSYQDLASVLNLTSVQNGSVTLYAQWRPHTYTVTFERNGAILGRMQPQSFTYDVPQALSANVFLHREKVFDHWNTAPDDSGTSYTDQEVVSNLSAVDGDTITLYAQWREKYFAIWIDDSYGGALYVEPTQCVVGTPVRLEAEPDPGMVVRELSAVYTDVEGITAALDLVKSEDEENVWTFDMPAGDVEVYAVFGPPAYLNEELSFYTSVSIGAEVKATFTIRQNVLNGFDSWYLELNKLDSLGNVLETKRFGEGQEGAVSAIGTVAWRAVYTDITAKEMGVTFSAVLHAFDPDGNEYYGNAVENSVKAYVIGELLKTDNTDATRTLCADLLNYGAAAQVYFDYDTDNLVNQDLGQATDDWYYFQTADEAPATQVNGANGPNLYGSVSIKNRVVLSITARNVGTGGTVQIQVRNHETHEVKEVLETTQVGSVYTSKFSNVEANEMRTMFDFVALVDGVETGQPLTWSVEGYVRAARLNSSISPAELALLNALLIYTDSAAAALP